MDTLEGTVGLQQEESLEAVITMQFFFFFFLKWNTNTNGDHVWWRYCEWNAVCCATWRWLVLRSTSQKRKTSCWHTLATVSFLALCHCNRVLLYRGLALWKACVCVCVYRPRVLPQSWFSVRLMWLVFSANQSQVQETGCVACCSFLPLH